MRDWGTGKSRRNPKSNEKLTLEFLTPVPERKEELWIEMFQVEWVDLYAF